MSIPTPKPRVDLVPPELMLAAGIGMEEGLERHPEYKENDWKDKASVTTMHTYAKLQRHLLQWAIGSEYDADGQHHLSAVAAQLSILCYLSCGDKDNRPGEISE